jgi:hypothetical protein
MKRTRLSTTVDSELLTKARSASNTATDAELIDLALAALLTQWRSAVIDEAYADAYRTDPLDAPDEWGDLASFRNAVSQ